MKAIKSGTEKTNAFPSNDNWKNLINKYSNSNDPWGLNIKKIIKTMKRSWPIYKNIFRVKIHGNKIPARQLMVISNHSGQIAIDGGLISMAFATEIDHPRILRPMVERFIIKIPFFGQWASYHGAVLGDRDNCLKVLKRDESPLIFPEGVAGIAKSTDEFYNLKFFTRGFYRLAIESGVDILPIAVVGAEEFYPHVIHAKKIAKIFGLPAFPITPTFPWLGPLGLIPNPSPVDIHIGNVHTIPKGISAESNDNVIDEQIKIIKNEIQQMIINGQKIKRDIFSRE